MKLFFTSFPLPSYLSLFIICLMLVPETVQSSECGLKNSPVRGQNRIYNGKEAEVNEWPWIASLGTSRSQFCGGAVIGEEWIITAAHCLLGKKPENLKIYLGEHDTTTDSETDKTEVYDVKDFIVHEKFHVPPYRNDIAVVKVSRSIDLNQHTPVCLPGENENFEGSTVTALGWGGISINGIRYVYPNKLQEAQLSIRDPSFCYNKFLGFGVFFDSSSNLCSGGLGASTCNGDSGGPVTIEDRELRHKLIGIVSYGEPDKCDKDKLSALASVSYYRAWIKEKTGI